MATVEQQLAGALLRLARQRTGLTQRAFAELIGIAQPTLSAYENGHRQPTLPTLLGMLHRCGQDLRLELVEHDNHDTVLAEWEATLDPNTQQRLRRQGYRLTIDAA